MDPRKLADAAEQALARGEEESVLPVLVAAAQRTHGARLWQWAGLLYRSIDEHEQALAAFAQASRLAPADARIAQGRAHTAMEAGLPAVGLFEAAWRLAPSDGAILIGLAAARLAAGEGDAGAAQLEAVLRNSPLWVAGHEKLAQFRAVLGQRERATDSLERALQTHPRAEQLWSALFNIHLRTENYEALGTAVARARAAGVPDSSLAAMDAIVASELDDSVRPDALFSGARADLEPVLNIWRIRHLIRVGEPEDALPIIDRELQTDRATYIWPYASLAWQQTGDQRAAWLGGDPRIVHVTDLALDAPALAALADTLRALHVSRAEYLDQSVRGGTQTDGPLFCRIDPRIRQLRTAIVEAVKGYVAQLPPADPRHPLLQKRRDRRIRFAGSWSVRLRRGGRHSSHVHPQGWISSAFYVSLPPQAGLADQQGWLTLGEPPENVAHGIEAARCVEPIAGRLVLFPSWMWHGTKPFAEGERLTVAFDVAPPR